MKTIGLLNNIRSLFFQPEENATPSSPEQIQPKTLGNTYTRNDYDVYNSEIVFGVVNTLSSNIAQMPLALYKDLSPVKKGAKRNLAYIIGHRPNDTMTSFEFIRYMEQSRNLYGNAYAFIRRDGSGNVKSLDPLNAALMTQCRDEDDNLWYKYALENETHLFFHRDIIHVRHFVSNSGLGISPIDVLQQTLSFERTVMKTSLEQITKSLGITGKIVLTGAMNDKLRDTLRAVLTQARNSENSVIITDPTFDYVSQPQTYFDFRALDTMNLTTQRIATAFGVPPHVAGDLSRATFSNIESQTLSYINSCLMPIIKQYEQEFNSKLLSPSEVLSGYTFQFDEMEMLRGDAVSRSSYYEIMLRIGALRVNEIRAAEGYSALEDGDERLISLNYVPYDLVRKRLERDLDTTAEPITSPVKGGEQDKHAKI